MPMSAEDLDELKGLLAVAKKRALNFGLCMGKKPEDTVFLLHRMKGPDILGRQAKQQGDTAKVTYGEIIVKGKKALLTCQSDIPAGIAKSTKKFLTVNKMALKITVLDAQGNMAEDDGDPEEPDDEVQGNEAPDAAAPQGDGGRGNAAEAQGDTLVETAPPPPPPPPPPETSPQEAAWARAVTVMGPLVDTFVQSGAEKAQAVGAAWQGALAAAAQGKFDQAMAVAQKIRPLLTAPQSAPVAPPGPQQQDAPAQTSPEASEWEKTYMAMSSLFEQAMALNPPNRTELQGAWARLSEIGFDRNQPATALAAAPKMEAALRAAIAKGATDQAQTVPPDVVPFQRARITWIGARSKMREEMGKLESAITAALAQAEDGGNADVDVKLLSARLEVFDSELEKVLEQITVTPAGQARDALKGVAVGHLNRYISALGDPFFKDVDKANGFASVAVAASAVAALTEVRTALRG